MSWLLRSGRKNLDAERPAETVLGVSCVIRSVGEDLVVEGRARTRKDAERLKRVMTEMLDEALGLGDEKK